MILDVENLTGAFNTLGGETQIPDDLQKILVEVRLLPVGYGQE